MSARLINREAQVSAAAFHARAKGRRPSYAAATQAQVTSVPRTPSTATPTQPSRPSEGSRVGPYPSDSSSRQCNVLQRRAATNSASLYSARSSNVDSYVPSHASSGRNAGAYYPTYGPPGRDNYHSFNVSQQSYNGSRRNNEQGRRYSRTMFQPGVLIRAPLHEQDFQGASGMSTVTVQQNRNTTDTRYGWVFSKVRPMIVVACYDRHYMAIPLYTHNKNGLAGKNQDEYVSIKDHRYKGPFKQLSKHGVLHTKEVEDEIYVLDPVSTAHFTYPLSRKYDLSVIYQGRLDTDSTKLLVELFTEYGPKPGSIRIFADLRNQTILE